MKKMSQGRVHMIRKTAAILNAVIALFLAIIAPSCTIDNNQVGIDCTVQVGVGTPIPAPSPTPTPTPTPDYGAERKWIWECNAAVHDTEKNSHFSHPEIPPYIQVEAASKTRAERDSKIKWKEKYGKEFPEPRYKIEYMFCYASGIKPRDGQICPSPGGDSSSSGSSSGGDLPQPGPQAMPGTKFVWTVYITEEEVPRFISGDEEFRDQVLQRLWVLAPAPEE